MSGKSLHVPDNFSLKPFYVPGDTIDILFPTVGPGLAEGDGYFKEDILAFMKEGQEVVPWHYKEEAASLIFDWWKTETSPYLKEAFARRERKIAAPLMIKAAGRFIQLVHWSDDKPVSDLKGIAGQVEQFPYAPVNCSERLDFVLKSAGHHHAFTVLDQLYDELRKKLALHLS